MKLISLHEDPDKVSTIDRLVHEGVFSSRAELYRTGAYLMISLPEARRLAMLDKLDSTLFGKEVRNCLSAIESGDVAIAQNRLTWLVDALRFRAIYTTLLGEQTREAYETAAEGFAKYLDVLPKISEYDQPTRLQITSDLRRDLSALGESVKMTEATRETFVSGHSHPEYAFFLTKTIPMRETHTIFKKVEEKWRSPLIREFSKKERLPMMRYFKSFKVAYGQ